TLLDKRTRIGSIWGTVVFPNHTKEYAMPSIVRCPKCRAEVELPDRPVDKTCCIRCKTVFPVQAAAPKPTKPKAAPAVLTPAAERVRVTCPKCRKALQVKGEAIGQKTQCPACKAVFVGELEEAEREDETPPIPSRKDQLGNRVLIGGAAACLLAVGLFV